MSDEMGGFRLEGFGRNAGDLVRLRRALYGPDDCQALMMRCYRLSKSDRISEPTVLRAWSAQDAAIDKANGFGPRREEK